MERSLPQWQGSGIKYEVAPPEFDRIPEFDPRAGEHFWIVLVAFRVDPATWDPTHQVHLDRENLVQVAAPGCYHCEQVHTPRLATRRCRGVPPNVGV